MAAIIFSHPYMQVPLQCDLVPPTGGGDYSYTSWIWAWPMGHEQIWYKQRLERCLCKRADSLSAVAITLRLRCEQAWASSIERPYAGELRTPSQQPAYVNWPITRLVSEDVLEYLTSVKAPDDDRQMNEFGQDQQKKHSGDTSPNYWPHRIITSQ